MGVFSSKPAEDVFQESFNDVSKSSQRRSSQSETHQLEDISKVIGNMKTEIDVFAGNRSDSRYEEFRKDLTTLEANLQEDKYASTSQQYITSCEEVLAEIKNCLERLEIRVSFNEQNEHYLDIASVRSHSFIHNSNQPPSSTALLNKKSAEVLSPISEERQQKFDHARSLENLEQQMQHLEKNIKLAMQLKDTKQLVIHERKIKTLYADLKLIRINEDTLLSKQKRAIGRKLARYSNQIKRFKKKNNRKRKKRRASERGTNQDSHNLLKPATQQETDDFAKMKQCLEELEVQALRVEEVNGDKKYKEVEQTHWTKVNSMDAFDNKEVERKSLAKKTEEYERQSSAMTSIRKIDRDLQEVKKAAEAFRGTTKDSSYIKLEQELRELWATLISYVQVPNEYVKRSKANVVNDIQYVLKNLSTDAQTRETYAIILKANAQAKSNLSGQEIANGLCKLQNNDDIHVSVQKSPNSQDIMDVHPDIQYFRQQIKNVTGVSTLPEDVPQNQKFQEQSQFIHADFLHHKINMIRGQVIKLQNKIEQFSGTYTDEEYLEIENELVGYFKELEDVDNRRHKTITVSRKTSADYIEKYFKEKSSEAYQLQSSGESDIHEYPDKDSTKDRVVYPEGCRLQNEEEPKPPILKLSNFNDSVGGKTKVEYQEGHKLLKEKEPKPPILKPSNFNDSVGGKTKVEYQEGRELQKEKEPKPPILKPSNFNDSAGGKTKVKYQQGRELQKEEEPKPPILKLSSFNDSVGGKTKGEYREGHEFQKEEERKPPILKVSNLNDSVGDKTKVEHQEGHELQKEKEPKPPIPKLSKSNDSLHGQTRPYYDASETTSEGLILHNPFLNVHSDKGCDSLLPRKIDPPIEKHINENKKQHPLLKTKKKKY